MKTIGEALSWARRALADSSSPDLDAQVLLAFALDVERVHLLAHRDEPLDADAWGRYQSSIKRRSAGEPIAYISGSKAFYDGDFIVNPHVLIPRPETELLLEEALRLTPDSLNCVAADIGAGCGALAVTFARHRAKASVYASDISQEALRVARHNAAQHVVDIGFIHGDLATPLIQRGIKVDLLMANLPYIASAELETLAVARHEPRLALDGGVDGMALIRRLLQQLPLACRDGAWILLEIGADQGETVRQLVESVCGVSADILPDYAGHDRIVRFQLESPLPCSSQPCSRVASLPCRPRQVQASHHRDGAIEGGS